MKLWIFNTIVLSLFFITLRYEHTVPGIYGVTWFTLIFNTIIVYAHEKKGGGK